MSKQMQEPKQNLYPETHNERSSRASSQKKKMPAPLKIFLFLIIPLTALIIISVVYIERQPIGLDDFIEVTFSGEDGNGTAKATFNTEKFASVYENKLKRHARSNLPFFYSSYAEMLQDLCLGGSLDKNKGLSNGDVVTYHWFCDKELAQGLFDIPLTYSDKKFTVDGLAYMH